MDNITDDQSAPSANLRLYRIPTRVLNHARSRPFTSDFIVTEVGQLAPSQAPVSQAENRSPRHRLLFLSSGSLQLILDEKTREISAKQAALIPAGTSYAYGPKSGSPARLYWIEFESQGSDSLLAWTGFSPGNPIVHCAAAENLKRHFNAIFNAVERGYTEHTTLQLSLALIKILISLHENPLDQDGKGSIPRIEAAMNRMREDVSHPQALSAYAQTAGYSVTQFSHLFRQHTGTSPINYLNELRIQRAAEYLNNSDWTIKQIAHELGFEDPLYFSRNFRKCVGLSPKAYRAR